MHDSNLLLKHTADYSVFIMFEADKPAPHALDFLPLIKRAKSVVRHQIYLLFGTKYAKKSDYTAQTVRLVTVQSSDKGCRKRNRRRQALSYSPLFCLIIY